MRKIVSVIGLAAGMVALLMVVVVSAAPDQPDASSIMIGPIYQGSDTTVQVGEIFTQRVRFERTEATGLLQFEIQIDKSIMFETFARPTISKSGNVETNKVFQTDEAFHWRGSVDGNGIVEIGMASRVADCGKPPEECPNAINVRVVNQSGETILSDTANVALAAGDFQRDQILIEPVYLSGPSQTEAECLIDCEPTFVVITNNNPVPIRALIVGEAPTGMNWNEMPNPADISPERAADLESKSRIFDVSLDANSTSTLTLNLSLVGNRADDAEFTLDLKACVEQAGNFQCPFADGLNDIEDLNYRSRRRDLGDAPDSSNHAATVIEAYTGVQGNFPTTADTALAGPHGPVHARPWPLHLGRRVSFEAEADIGPDQDGINNIEPGLAIPMANQDRGDDGVPLNLVDLEACTVATIPVRVAILPSIIANLEGPAYLNIWLDGNRDGDWADEAECDTVAYEHIVIDHEVDVATLGAGFHTISVTTNLIPKGMDESAAGAWMRVMLSDEKSTKLTGESYGDGRGKGSPYALGETEDYLYFRDVPGSEGYQPEIEITVEEVDRGDERRQALGTDGRAPDANARPYRELIIRFRNVGFKAGATLSLEVTLANSTDQIIYDSWAGCLTCTRSVEDGDIWETVGRDLDAENLAFPRTKTFQVGTLQPQSFGTIVLGWTGCLTCTREAEMASFHTIKAFTEDREWQVEVARAEDRVTSPFIRMGWTGCLTCTRQAEDVHAVNGWDEGVAAIKAQPGQTIRILKNGMETGQTGVADAEGFWYATLQVDPDEPAVFEAITLERGLVSEPSNKLDMSCPLSGVQILSLDRVEDGQVTDYAPLKPAEFTSRNLRYIKADEYNNVTLPGLGKAYNRLVYRVCRDQETDLSLNYLGNDISFENNFNFDDITISTWTGCLTCTRSAESLVVKFDVSVTPNGFTQPIEYEYVLEYGTPGHFKVTDQQTGEPIADAEITVLRKAKRGFGRATWVDVGHCVTTLKDGSWSALVPDGEYMVMVKKDGYQTYRSRPFVVFEPNDEPLFDKTAGRHELGFNIGMPPVVSSVKAAEIVDVSNGNMGNIFVHISANTPVRFVNNGGADTSLTARIDGRGPLATAIDSGVLASGESFTVEFDQLGTYTYQVAGDSEQEGTIVVTPSSGGATIYLPLITR